MSSIVEVLIQLFFDAIPQMFIPIGNRIVKVIFPGGLVEEDSILSGAIGAISTMAIIAIIIFFIYSICINNTVRWVAG